MQKNYFILYDHWKLTCWVESLFSHSTLPRCNPVIVCEKSLWFAHWPFSTLFMLSVLFVLLPSVLHVKCVCESLETFCGFHLAFYKDTTKTKPSRGSVCCFLQHRFCLFSLHSHQWKKKNLLILTSSSKLLNVFSFCLPGFCLPLLLKLVFSSVICFFCKNRQNLFKPQMRLAVVSQNPIYSPILTIDFWLKAVDERFSEYLH